VAILLNVSAFLAILGKYATNKKYNNGRYTTNKDYNNGLHFIIKNKMLPKSILKSHDS
jgi:hypothetical protein